MRLIITRHGETEENKKKILQGHMPGTLSEEGISQAKKLALRLKPMKIDCIYSSDLARAADTAREIRKFHPDSPLVYTEALREKDLGPYTGRPWKDCDWDNPPVEVETGASVQVRVKKLLDSIYDQHKDETVLFVCHAGVKGNILRVIFNDPDKKIATPGNTAVTIIDFDEGRNHQVHVLNCTGHLD
ncbi:TPA: histidine phosphatase family protein [Candidatus Woesearchaeota archaeon]|nr:histidine phosphatase family protein [Candidatus Woesearchaeota archaeon]